MGQKSKLLILSEYVNETEKILYVNKDERLQKKWSVAWYFSHKVFYVTIVQIFYEWKQSVKLLLGKYELAYVNMTS